MKFTVELDDFWIGEDSDIQTELRNHIINSVLRQVLKSIEGKVESQIQSKVNEMVEKTMFRHAQIHMDECFKNAKFKSRVSENGNSVEKLVSLEEFVINKFKNDTGWSNPNEKIEKLAKEFSVKFATEIKGRYELLFATQIVRSLDKEGLLKDNVARLLMENNETKG